MRHKLLLGVGLVALGASPAWGQFAADRSLPALPSSPASPKQPNYTPLYSSPTPPSAPAGAAYVPPAERPATAAPLANLPTGPALDARTGAGSRRARAHVWWVDGDEAEIVGVVSFGGPNLICRGNQGFAYRVDVPEAQAFLGARFGGGLVVAGGLGLRLGLEPFTLVVGVGELGEGVAELPAGDDELETFGHVRLGAVPARQR